MRFGKEETYFDLIGPTKKLVFNRATITPQQNASLEALHQSMRLSRGSNDESFSESDNQQQEKNQEQHQEQQQQQHQQQQQQQHQQQQQQAQSPQPQPQNQVQQVTPAEAEEKPAVGSEEWHRQRRENHKQVERRRRENINEGINQIARIVPGCEKNKGSILSRAAIYIRQLKDNEAATLEKWTLEKLLTDQAISELNRQVEMFKAELERVKLENNYLKRELDTVSNTESRSKKQKLDNLQDES